MADRKSLAIGRHRPATEQDMQRGTSQRRCPGASPNPRRRTRTAATRRHRGHLNPAQLRTAVKEAGLASEPCGDVRETLYQAAAIYADTGIKVAG
jgi:hypothetical protein